MIDDSNWVRFFLETYIKLNYKIKILKYLSRLKL